MSSKLWPAGSDPPSLAPHQELAVDWIRDRLTRYSAALLADDVGLGKSWVAATIAREHSAAAREVELIVPASLVTMWRDVQRSFGFDATIRTHATVRRSEQFSGAPSLIVVDEAHRFRNPATKGWRRLAKRIGSSFVIFLTATPIWNDPADLLALLRLLVPDDVLKSDGVASIELGLETTAGRARVLDRLVLRRRHDINSTRLGLGEISARQIEYGVPDSWRTLEKKLESLTFPQCLRFSRAILSLLMLRRLHSSPEALRASLERQLRFCRTGLDLLREGFRLERHEFTRLLLGDEGVQELLFPELFLATEDEPDEGELLQEIEAIESILETLPESEDPKLSRLIELLVSEPKPTLVFVGAIETARALWNQLSPAIKCAVATGSWTRSPSGHRTIGEIADAFQQGRVELLITTDVGGEGLNLQRADRVIHYDLPWSPMRLEQRNGRARRLGRDGRPLEVVTFLPAGEPSPAWLTLARKRASEQQFWAVGAPTFTPHTSLARLPSRITPSEPQAKRWDELPATADRSILLRRYRVGVELELSATSSSAVLDEIPTEGG